MFINLLETKDGVKMDLTSDLTTPHLANGAVHHGTYELAGHNDDSAGKIVNVMLNAFRNQPTSAAVAGLKEALKNVVVASQSTKH